MGGYECEVVCSFVKNLIFTKFPQVVAITTSGGGEDIERQLIEKFPSEDDYFTLF